MFNSKEMGVRNAYIQRVGEEGFNQLANSDGMKQIMPLGPNKVLMSYTPQEVRAIDGPYHDTNESIVFELIFNSGHYVGYTGKSFGRKRFEENYTQEAKDLVRQLKESVHGGNPGVLARLFFNILLVI